MCLEEYFDNYIHGIGLLNATSDITNACLLQHPLSRACFDIASLSLHLLTPINTFKSENINFSD